VSKLANMLRMLLLLQRSDILQIKELSEELEVTPRQIRRYKDELEQAGYYIESIPGKYGGYYVNEKQLTITMKPKILPEENVLIEIFQDESLEQLKDIMAMINVYHKDKKVRYFIKSTLKREDIKNYLIIQNAMINQRSLDIEYALKSHQIIIRSVNPYFTFRKYGIDYLGAYEHQNSKFIYLRLSRMVNIKESQEKFIKDQKRYDYEQRIVKENAGIFYSEHMTKIIIKAQPKIKMIIDDLFEGDILYKDTPEGEMIIEIQAGRIEEMVHRILSLGSQVEVLEPLELRNMVNSEIRRAYKIYEGENT
jgi:predicted DNA-binding transcriptional regulator YafY